MTDLQARFRVAQQIPAPDLWPDIEHRLVAADPVDRPPLRAVGSTVNRPSSIRKVLTIAAAFLIAIPAIAFALFALRSDGHRVPGNDVPSSPFERVHGWIAFAGSQGVIAVDPSVPSDQIPLTGGGLNQPIAWSSDGSTLLVRRGDCCGGRHAIFAIRSDGTETRLTPSAISYGASFSPDGSVVVYGQGTGNGQRGYVDSLYLVNASGGTPTLLAKGDPGGTEYDFPAWSPDGAVIAYTARGPAANDPSISLMSPEGTNQRVLVPASAVGSGWIYGLDWSPDGSRLVFGVVTAKDKSDIWVVDANGSGLKKLISGGWFPSWSPDGSRIAFTLQGRLTTMNPDGGDVVPVAGMTSIGPSWVAVAWNPVSPSGG